jgi:hypothetical protein
VSTQFKVGRVRIAAQQRGQAALLTVLALAIGLGAVFYSLLGSTRQTIAYDRITNAALAQAKDALIGYAAADANRPGSLPCPDTNNDGNADIYSGSECPNYIGRLPWRTLGLPDLRDGSGERLWYAVTREFARNPSCGSTCPMNSDTKGTLTIAGTSPATNIVAVVFAPGPVVGTQDRSTANQNTIAHFLDGGNETGIGTLTFVTGATTGSFNDRLLTISGGDVMTPVEKRVARVILKLLADYRTGSDCNCYPWADNNWNGTANSGARQGGIPLISASPDSWLSSAGYNPPAWLTSNQWYKVIFYAVSDRDAEGGSAGYPRYNVNSTSNVRVVLLTTGPAVAGDNRPSSNWNDYVNDYDNNDGGYDFITPLSTAYARDRIYWLTSP